MKFNTLFIDLDDTLYDRGNGLWDAIRARMNQYMHECVGLPEQEVPALRRYYFETYGTTLRGLQIHYQVDVDEYLAYVHDLPLNDFIACDPQLNELLSGISQPKWILTNSSREHAQRVLDVLGIRDLFSGIIDIRALNFKCKPHPEAYQIAMEIAGEHEPTNCLYLDDSPLNLAPAKAIGMTTVLIGNGDESPAAHKVISKIHDLKIIYPELWDHHSVV